jgi:probable rRNA maturation factor
MPRLDIQDPPASEPADDPEPARGLAVDVVHEAGDWPAIGAVDAIIAPVVVALSRHACAASHMPAQACIALTDDAAMRRLNAQFRAKDKPTNVLSFPALGRAGSAQGGGLGHSLGDIVLGFETVMTEAADQGIAAPDHVRHLVLHGFLHLMGYDHETDADAVVMEALEIEILAGLGIANPYAEAAGAPVTT